MHFAPLTPAEFSAWAELLAAAFDRTPADMGSLLDWLHQGWPLVAWGAWDGERLAAQYSCRIVDLGLPGRDEPARVGMSINMAVHPDYRGRGLIKHVARPVYEAIAAQGGIAGVGFSNAEGVRVDLKSKSYGYRVVGKMTSTVVWLSPPRRVEPLCLTASWPDDLQHLPLPPRSSIHFLPHTHLIRHRFARHPFRRYCFGVWREGEVMRGLAVCRPIRYGSINGSALLSAYGDDLPELLRRWAASLRAEGRRFIHVLTSPGSSLRRSLPQIGYTFDLPYTRTPYFLTAKPLDETLSRPLFDFTRWDCSGGDIL
jgi:GNAT superfamily N-acetyltransferase